MDSILGCSVLVWCEEILPNVFIHAFGFVDTRALN